MTGAEESIVRALRRVVTNRENHSFLDGLRMGEPIDERQRRQLLRLAWQVRNRLPADIVVLAALKGAAA